mmetsp:Transcript_27037/g.108223  ORF Transcript_27037/g.108223 Transcript_27037/m.108223 type:complete len:412 (-) Transcript_27037:79-1314(-)
MRVSTPRRASGSRSVLSPQEKRALDATCAGLDRAELRAACARYGVAASAKDATPRIQQKLRRFAAAATVAEDDPIAGIRDEDAVPSSPERHPQPEEQQQQPQHSRRKEEEEQQDGQPKEEEVRGRLRRRRLDRFAVLNRQQTKTLGVVVVATAIAAVALAVTWRVHLDRRTPTTRGGHQKVLDVRRIRAAAAVAVAATQHADDATEEIAAWLSAWRRRGDRHCHAAALLAVCETSDLAERLETALVATADARVVRPDRRPEDDAAAAAKDVVWAALRDAASFEESDDDAANYVLVVEDVRTASPLYAESLIDPYLATPRAPDLDAPVDRAAFVWLLVDALACETGDLAAPLSPPDAARAALKRYYGDDLPPAFYNRIQHAALLCSSLESSPSSASAVDEGSEPLGKEESPS